MELWGGGKLWKIPEGRFITCLVWEIGKRLLSLDVVPNREVAVRSGNPSFPKRRVLMEFFQEFGVGGGELIIF